LVTKRPPLLYRTIQVIAFPAVVLYFAARLLTNRSYWPNFFERLGFLPKSFIRTKPGAVWLHAVSLGEVASATSLLRQLRQLQPNTPLYVSVSTIAGRRAAAQQLNSLVDGIFFCPIDYASCVRRTLRAIRPALLIVLETEIWPNLYFEVKRTGAKLAIVNGRISNRTWPQYQGLRWFFKPVLQLADLVMVQSPTDFGRYCELGVPSECLSVAGNLKFDAAKATIPLMLPTFGAEKIWIAASTVGPNERGSVQRHNVDEDDIVLEAFEHLARQFPKLLLLIAPRQPTRFDEVARKLAGRHLHWQRRSQLQTELTLPGVILLDSIGELAGFYHLADAVFVGGSLAPRGGHNILEPAAAGAPVVVGPHMQNFESIARDFLDSASIHQIDNQKQLLAAIKDLLDNPAEARALGQRARQLVERRQGVSRQIALKLQPLYHSACIHQPHGALARLLLFPLAVLWEYGGTAKRDHSEQRAASLLPIPVPVISIGGITVGGAGKTPFASYLASALRQYGFSPGLLTRGYRRRYPAENLVFPAGAVVSPFLTGDEAQIFLRAGVAPLGIGAKRYETARILLNQFPQTDVLLLDDGFQHALMPRDFDVVLIDGLDPFGQDGLVPLGRLREPLSALDRAHAFVVTRAENDLRFKAICDRLRQYNDHAPAFRSRLVARGWRDYHSGQHLGSLVGRRVAAFCGLGNPQNFWNTLETLGLDVVFRWAFPDHHGYKPAELSRLAHQARLQGAELLVTTEKDRINCPDHLEAVIHPLELAWLEIEFELDDEAGFLSLLNPVLRQGANYVP
jgi:tetraacyldisaccharide 4'-kinase